jgi:hypothetical protein
VEKLVEYCITLAPYVSTLPKHLGAPIFIEEYQDLNENKQNKQTSFLNRYNFCSPEVLSLSQDLKIVVVAQ